MAVTLPIQRRKEIEAVLEGEIKRLALDKQSKKAVIDHICEKRNVTQGFVNRTLGAMQPISYLGDAELYWFMDGISHACGSFSMSEYFTKIETDAFENTKAEAEKDLFPLVFDNFIKMSSNQYKTTISLKQIQALQSAGVIRYNTKTQREQRRVKTSKGEIYRITLYQRSVKDICKNLIDGTYIPDDISLNLCLDNENCADIKIKNGRLEIHEGELDIIDGYHRWTAALQALAQEPRLEFSFFLNIFVLHEDQANAYIIQKNKQNKMTKTHQEAIKAEESIKDLCRQLNAEQSFPLRGEFVQYKTNKYNFDYDTVVNIMNHIYSSDDLSSPVKISRLSRKLAKIFEAYFKERDTITSTDIALCIYASFKDEDEAVRLVKDKIINNPMPQNRKTISKKFASQCMRYLNGDDEK